MGATPLPTHIYMGPKGTWIDVKGILRTSNRNVSITRFLLPACSGLPLLYTMGELETKDVWTTAIAAIALFFSVVGVAFTFITRRYDVNQALEKDRESKDSAATERLRQRVLTAAACAHRYSVEGIQVRSTEQL